MGLPLWRRGWLAAKRKMNRILPVRELFTAGERAVNPFSQVGKPLLLRVAQ
jgi:hypothetical protein